MLKLNLQQILPGLVHLNCLSISPGFSKPEHSKVSKKLPKDTSTQQSSVAKKPTTLVPTPRTVKKPSKDKKSESSVHECTNTQEFVVVENEQMEVNFEDNNGC